jgi:drug/metabolite transporter (DMT)-like permease
LSRVNQYLPFIFLTIPVTWAGSFIAGKYVIHDISAPESVFLRFLFSAIVMLPALILFRKKQHPDFREKKFLLHLAIVILTSGIAYHLLFFEALKYTTPTRTALIIALNPFFTAIGERFIFKYKRPLRFYIGFIIALAGAIWVIIARGDGENWTMPGTGEMLCLLASISWSVYTIASKVTKQKEWDSLWIGAYNYLFTALLILPFVVKIQFSNLSPNGWIGLWYMAIFPTAIGYTLYYIGIQKKGAAWAAAYIYLVPSFTAQLDFMFFDEKFTIPMIFGTVLVITGLFLANVKMKILFR